MFVSFALSLLLLFNTIKCITWVFLLSLFTSFFLLFTGLAVISVNSKKKLFKHYNSFTFNYLLIYSSLLLPLFYNNYYIIDLFIFVNNKIFTILPFKYDANHLYQFSSFVYLCAKLNSIHFQSQQSIFKFIGMRNAQEQSQYTTQQFFPAIFAII